MSFDVDILVGCGGFDFVCNFNDFIGYVIQVMFLSVFVFGVEVFVFIDFCYYCCVFYVNCQSGFFVGEFFFDQFKEF